MKKKMLALLLSFCMIATFAGCSQNQDDQPTNTDNVSTGDNSGDVTNGGEDVGPAEYVPTGSQKMAGKTYGTDYISLYDKFGKDVKITDVKEDPNTGLAYIEKDGEVYELGLDFLTMAMVFNTICPEFGDEDAVYAEWWKYYITRFNSMMVEIPLYSNEYYDLYNTQIGNVKENPTNPYWGAQKAVIDWTSSKDDNSIILGSTTDLSGMFRMSSFAKTSPGSADLDIENLTTGLATVVTTKEGGFAYNDVVVKNVETTDNADGSLTYTFEIYDDLKFSDGSPITAKNYLYSTLAFATPVADEASGTSNTGASLYTGFSSFKKYDGTNAGDGITKTFSGLRLLDDYKFSVTVVADYNPYYYAISFAAFGPTYKNLWVGDADIADDGEGVYFTDNFYAKNGDSYTMAAHIKNSSRNTDQTYPYSGAYVVESFNESDLQAVLKKNTYFKGNYEGTVPSIDKIVYVKVVSETQLQQLQSGNVDFIAGITGGSETDEAISLADGSNGKYAYIHYARAGYGKMDFRGDLGSVQFDEVRQAIAYCMDRAQFAKDFTGGYGGVVDGPYYTGSWMYQAAVKAGMQLDSFETSADSAISVLEAGGWIYDVNGDPYTEGVRYKRIPAAYASETDKNFASIDGVYKTVQIGDDYYMPLVLNWYGTSPNPFTDLLVTGFLENENFKKAGFEIQNTIGGDLMLMLQEYYQDGDNYGGKPVYNVFNLATGFTSAMYDYTFNISPDPTWDDNRMWFNTDDADVYLLNS